MPTFMTPGRLLFHEIVPESFRQDLGDDQPVDSKVVKDILQRVAENSPENYRDISHKILKLGAKASTETSSSFSLEDLRSPIDKKAIIAQVELQEAAINANPKLSGDQKENERIKLYAKLSGEFPGKVYDAAFAKGSNLARMVASGARGNKGQLNSNIGADWLMIDSNGRPVPVPIKNSYSEGLSPAEYFASSYGTRRGLISTKFAVQDSGYLAKQLAAAAHDLVVTTKDCGTSRGVPTDAEDRDNIGAVLARPVGGYGANTVINAKVLKDLRQQKVGNFLVRSPVTCQAHGGLCATCAGLRERNHLPKMMDNLGLAAASSLSEVLSQGMLCLAKGTQVRMADWSTKAIEQVEPGEWILGADQDGKTFLVKVLNRFYNGVRKVVKSEFKVGHRGRLTLVSTKDHKVLCKRGVTNGGTWRCVRGVYPVGLGQEFSAIRPQGFSGVGLRHEPLALFLGLVLGDGCTTDIGKVTFSCGDPTQITQTEKYLEQFNLKLVKNPAQPFGYRFSKIQNKFRHGNPATEAARHFGLTGKLAHQKSIPTEVWSWNDQSLLALIAGLTATDGSVYKASAPRSSLSFAFEVTSESMAQQLKDLLAWRFGIWASKLHVSKVTDLKKRPAYKVCVTAKRDVVKLASLLCIPGEKNDKLRAASMGSRDCSEGWVRTSQEDAGEIDTFDLEVDHPDHLFVLANGLIVSNSEKHSGGVANSAGRTATGFKAIDSLVQVPDIFPGGATVAQLDGKVGKIEDAPQGGKFVFVNDEKHYVPGDADLLVKPGETLEAGDVISSGVPNPADIVKHKGIGQGRMYFVQAMQKAFRDNGIGVNRRNLEVLSRALVNHVRVTDPEGFNGALPDDVVEYNSLEHDYQPEATKLLAPSKAHGTYLQKPSLYFSVGTRITPRVSKTLEDNGEHEIEVGDKAPGFEPEMQRVMEIPAFKPDWMSQFHGSYLSKRLKSNVESGDAVSHVHGLSYVPGLAKAVDFGRPPKGEIGY